MPDAEKTLHAFRLIFRLFRHIYGNFDVFQRQVVTKNSPGKN